jgi:signal peptide peptidase SppA
MTVYNPVDAGESPALKNACEPGDPAALWLGTPDTLRQYLLKRQRMDAVSASEMKAILLRTEKSVKAPVRVEGLEPFLPTVEDEEAPGHYLLSEGNGIGIISVYGSLTYDAGRWGRYWGLVAYDDIKQALQTARDRGLRAVLIDWGSPGGTAIGADECAAFIREFNDSVLPVYSYTSTQMCSGAYWNGSAAREVWASKMANVGSIGVIAVLTEYTQMLKEIGITPTVFRSGKYKALGNPYEKVDQVTRETIQASLDEVYNYFVADVARFRRYAPEYVLEHMAEGRVFTGARGKEAGLVDRVGTLKDVLDHVLSAHPLDTQQGYDRVPISSRNKVNTMSSQVTTETPESAEDPAAGAETQEPGSPEAGAEAESESVSGTLNIEPMIAAATAPLQAQVTQLTSDLVEARVSAKEAESRADAAEARAAQAEAQAARMAQVVAREINRMQVALGGSATDVSALSGDQMMAEYDRLYAPYAKRFPGGPQVHTSLEDDAEENHIVNSVAELQYRAQLRAASIPSK